jgi:uncharacterized protein YggE
VTTITVRGEGMARTAPDEATLELAVESLRPTPAEALADVAERGEALVTLCHEVGIGPERRVTSGATVAEHREHVDGSWQHRGYRATSTLVVRVEDAELVGRLLAGAVERAQARVAGPWWTIGRDNAARLEACREAARDARRKAEAYAEALGARLGAIVAVREPGRQAGPRERGVREVFAMRSADEPGAPAVEAGELEVTAAVIVRFALEQG